MILSLRQLKRPGRKRRPRLNGRQIALRATAAVIALSALAFGGWRLAHYFVNAIDTCMNSGPTLVQHAGPSRECVGVTDGAFLFQFGSQQQDAVLRQIETLILKEDQRVSASGKSYVSVVYLMPAAGTMNAESITDFTRQLEGAYTAQIEANGPNSTRADISNSGQSPLIQRKSSQIL